MIEVGDKVKTKDGSPYTITKVERGTYGLYIEGTGIQGFIDSGFLPYELPPEIDTDWYGWARRGFLVLDNGVKVGGVSFGDYDTSSLAQCEELWERTKEQMRGEECKPQS